MIFGCAFVLFATLAFTGNIDDSGRSYVNMGIFLSVLAFLAFAVAIFLFVKAYRIEPIWRSKK